MVDQTRFEDLQELHKAIKESTTLREREHYEKIRYKVLHESIPIQSLRNDLAKAFRNGDMYRVQQIQERIMKTRQDETYGKSTGNFKEINEYE